MSDNDIVLSEQQKMLLGNICRDMGYHGDWCFYVAPDQDIGIFDSFIPAMVFRDVQSYFSMDGPLYGDVPFAIGQKLAEAKACCQLMNEHIGLDDEVVKQLLESAGLGTS